MSYNQLFFNNILFVFLSQNLKLIFLNFYFQKLEILNKTKKTIFNNNDVESRNRLCPIILRY